MNTWSLEKDPPMSLEKRPDCRYGCHCAYLYFSLMVRSSLKRSHRFPFFFGDDRWRPNVPPPEATSFFCPPYQRPPLCFADRLQALTSANSRKCPADLLVEMGRYPK